MVLADEGELAVHTVAAAAYQLLRNIKFKRGRSDAHDLFLRGLVGIAQDLATGKIHAIPSSITESAPALRHPIEAVCDGLVTGTISSFEDISPIDVPEKEPFWAEFNRPASFLRHADKDPDASLDLSKIKKEELLMRATTVFFEITNRLTPEIEAYYMFAIGDREDSGLPEDVRREFASLSIAQKKKECLRWIQKRRASGPDARM